jgi:DNA-binding MarR family transcriptional regulator
MDPTDPAERDGAAPDVGSEIGQTRPFATRGEELVVAVLRTADEAHRFMVGILRDEDLTDQQYNVLRILRGAGPDGLPTLAIGERMVERTPGVTRLIDRLSAKGLVARERDTADRRRIVCRITDDGLAVLERIQPRLDRAVAAFEAALPPGVLAELGGRLDVARRAFRSATPGAT